MKFLVIGCGSIGERHIKNLRNLSIDNILACDIDSKRINLVKEKYNAEIYKDVDEALENKPDAVLICTPPNLHIPMALKAIEYNAHIFIEKPISNNLEKVNYLLDEAKRKDLIVSVGYNLRFNQGIQLIKKMIDDNTIGRILSARAEFGQYLPNWRPSQDYRKSYTAKSDMGGGIILDGSHEIDYIRWILGDVTDVFCFADKIGNLDVDVEDTAEILLKLKNNIIANIHLDFVQREYSRGCKIVGEKGTIVWDYLKNCVKVYYDTTEHKLVYLIKTDMYMDEMKHFIECIKGKACPLINGEDARKVLEIALAAKESAKSGRIIKL
jgi:predicted dehydrogenase